MFKLSTIVAAAVLSGGAMSAIAQTTPADHTQHHAADTTPAAQSAAVPAAGDRTVSMEKQMQTMRVMREKLAAAKTPEERKAVMSEHMKTMQESMAMMDKMKSPSGGMGMTPMMEGTHQHHQMMEMRMEMMESMMRMMMDRMQ